MTTLPERPDGSGRIDYRKRAELVIAPLLNPDPHPLQEQWSDFNSMTSEQLIVALASALQETAAHERERCAKLVPTNWLDPALTHMLGKKISARDVEKVMRSVKAAIHKMED